MNESDKREISISSDIYEQIENKIKGTEFNSVSKYVEYVLKQVLEKTSEKEVYSKEEEEQVKKRLKGLGYLE